MDVSVCVDIQRNPFVEPEILILFMADNEVFLQFQLYFPEERFFRILYHGHAVLLLDRTLPFGFLMPEWSEETEKQQRHE
jgi:hypothetical protein